MKGCTADIVSRMTFASDSDGVWLVPINAETGESPGVNDIISELTRPPPPHLVHNVDAAGCISRYVCCVIDRQTRVARKSLETNCESSLSFKARCCRRQDRSNKVQSEDAIELNRELKADG
jgi:hypothetical protein